MHEYIYICYNECLGWNRGQPDIPKIKAGAFSYCDGLTEITIPDKVTSIGENAFYECSALSTVYYGGEESLWNNIEIKNGNDCLINAKYPKTVNVTVSDDKKVFNVKSANIPKTSTVILALYSGSKFVEMQVKPYDAELTFTTDKSCTRAKVMIWESLESMKSVCGAECVEL